MPNLLKLIMRLTGMANAPSLMMQGFSQGYCSWAITRKFTTPASPPPQYERVQTSRYASFTLKLFLPCLALLAMMPFVASAASLNNGQQLYMAHCAGCHGMNGVSVIPQAKDFSKAKLLAQPDRSLIDLIRSGRDMMPAYLGILDDREILDVINYLRILN